MILLFKIWVILILIAAILIEFRFDRKAIHQAMISKINTHNLFTLISSIFILVVVLPTSIYFSIKHLLKR
jgi:hypothetical protein